MSWTTARDLELESGGDDGLSFNVLEHGDETKRSDGANRKEHRQRHLRLGRP